MKRRGLLFRENRTTTPKIGPLKHIARSNDEKGVALTG
jgi:hypothetical protein